MKTFFSTFVACLILATFGQAQEKLSPKEAADIAADAYVYGYSLVTTDVTRVQMSNVPKAEEKEANWLPAPKGPFVLMMQRYGPKKNSPSIHNGSWTPPAVKRGN